MSYQIRFFEKSRSDLEYSIVSATASQGSTYASYALNRSNRNAWITSGSVDADNTTWTVSWTVGQTISEILLVKHNFKAFTIKYWNGSAYVAFSTPISQTVCTEETSWYSFNEVETTSIQITITGTQVVDDEKRLYQFICTNLIGQFNAWPVIDKPMVSKYRQTNAMLSGKSNVYENAGKFSCSLVIEALTDDDDLAIIESLYDSHEGFLVWLCGGSETQFKTIRQGYRLEDIFLMKCSNEYSPLYRDGLYKTGIKIQMDLEETIR